MAVAQLARTRKSARCSRKRNSARISISLSICARVELECHDAARLRDKHASEEQRARLHVAVEREGQLLECALTVERAHRRVVRHLLAHHAHAQRRTARTHVSSG